MGRKMDVRRVYSPTDRPVQRVRLLRELGRGIPRAKFSFSPREVRRTVGSMFGFRPLVNVSPSELSLLRKFTGTTVAQISKKYLGTIQHELGKQPGDFLRAQRAAEMRQMLSRAEVYEPFSFQGSRDLALYQVEVGFDVLKDVQDLHRARNRPVRVLDVGSSTALMAADLKEQMGAAVDIHTLTPENEPHFKASTHHILTAEYMPATFRGKFDYIVSSRALEYAVLPNLALQNIAGALAPGGVAKLYWRAGRVHYSNLEGGLNRFFSEYKKSKPTPAGLKLVWQEKEGGGLYQMSPADTKKWVTRVVQEHGGFAAQAMAWCNEVGKLQRNRNFKVSIPSLTPAMFGYIPGRLIIERK